MDRRCSGGILLIKLVIFLSASAAGYSMGCGQCKTSYLTGTSIKQTYYKRISKGLKCSWFKCSIKYASVKKSRTIYKYMVINKCCSGYDSEDCFDTDECSNELHSCGQNCHNTCGGYTCSCNSGYKINENGKQCDDINECQIDNGGCAQNCINTIGSYYCTCTVGPSSNASYSNCTETIPVFPLKVSNTSLSFGWYIPSNISDVRVPDAIGFRVELDPGRLFSYTNDSNFTYSGLNPGVLYNFKISGSVNNSKMISGEVSHITVPISHSVNVGDTVTLNCFTTLNGSLNVTWDKNGLSSNLPTGRITGATDSLQLNIENVHCNDFGKYECTVKDFTSKESTVVELAVSPNGTVQVVSEIRPNASNETVELHCQSGGGPSNAYQWYNSSGLLPREVTPHLIILLGTQPDDTGNYMCVVSNEAGVGMASTEIYKAPIIISKSGMYISVQRDHMAILSFKITQAIPLVKTKDIIWIFPDNSSTIDIGRNNASDYIFSEDKLTLKILKAGIMDGGSYTVYVNNSKGKDSAKVSLTITGVAPQITNLLRNATLMEGENHTLICPTLADPMFNIVFTWRFNGEIISTEEPKYKIVTNNSLQFSELTVIEVTGSDEGEYKCSVSNRFGSESTSASVTIRDSPKFLFLPLETRNAVLGEVFTMECQAKANPAPLVYWIKGFTLINSSSSRTVERVTTGTLVLSNFSRSDAGDICACVASNEIGIRFSPNITINIIARPSIILVKEATGNIISHNGLLTRSEGSSLNLICTASGSPLPSIQWLRNGFILQDNVPSFTLSSGIEVNSNDSNEILNRTSSLHIYKLRLTDDAKYSCRAMNGFVAPIIGQNVWEFKLEVKAFNDCNSSPNACQNGGHCIDGIDSFTCNCTESDSGYFTGERCSEEITEYTPPKITQDPQDQIAVLYSSVTLTCVAEGLPQPLIQWYQDDQPLNVYGQQYTIFSIQPSDRGIQYHCRATSTAFDGRVAISRSASVLIRGLIQQTLAVDLVETNRKSRQIANSSDFLEQVNEVNALLSGSQLNVTNGNSTLKSEVISVSGVPENIIIVTTVSSADTVQSTEGTVLSSLLAAPVSLALQQAFLVINQPIQVSPIVRFDGCPDEVTECGSVGSVMWPETELGQTVELPCPCGVPSVFGFLNLVATRQCRGNYLNGGIWNDPDCSNCNLAGTTQSLCELSNIDNGAQLASELVTVFTNNTEEIRIEDLALATSLLEIILPSDIQEDKMVSRDILITFDQLASAPEEAVEASQQMTNSSARLLNLLQTVAEYVPLERNESFNFSGESFGIEVQVIIADPMKELVPDLSSIATDIAINSNMSIPSANIALQGSAISLNRTELRVSAALYANDVLFQQRTNTIQSSNVGSVVAALTIFRNGSEIFDLQEPVQITLERLDQEGIPRCTFWNFSFDGGYGGWDDSGCSLVNGTNDTSFCECDHLTNFALLLDVFPGTKIPDKGLQNQFLTAVSYIGTSVSIICLILTVIPFLVDRDLRKGIHRKLLINLCVALTGLYATFIISTFSMAVWQWCIVISALMQYFFLATFFLMTAEAINLYRMLVQVFKPDLKNYLAISMAVCWVVPAFIVAFSLAPRYQNYFHKNFCRVYDYSFYFGVIIPFGLVYIFNWATFIIIIISLSLRPNFNTEYHGSKKAGRNKMVKENLWIAMGLSVLVGLGWGIGLLASTGLPFYIQTPIEWIFTVLTAFQGIIIFFIYCLRAKESRQVWKRILCCDSKKHPPSLISNNSQSANRLNTLRKQASEYVSAKLRYFSRNQSSATSNIELDSLKKVNSKKQNGFTTASNDKAGITLQNFQEPMLTVQQNNVGTVLQNLESTTGEGFVEGADKKLQ